MCELVLGLAHALVQNKESVDVQFQENDGIPMLTLMVAPDDMEKIIGHDGRTARSIRTVLQAASAKLHKAYKLEIKPNPLP